MATEESVYDEPDFTLRKKRPAPLERDDEVFIDGFLQKLGRIFKSWKRRWFVLSGGKLYYYKNEACTRFGGEIYLERCESVSPLNASHLGAAFQIKSKSRTYVLAAATDQKRREWMEAVKKAIYIAKHPRLLSEPKSESSVVYETPAYATVSPSRHDLPSVVEEVPSPYAETGSGNQMITRERTETAVSTVSEYAVVVKDETKRTEKASTAETSGADELREALRRLGETDFTSTDPISLEAAEASFKQLRDLVESIE